jgi:predicted transcriptional regulator
MRLPPTTEIKKQRKKLNLTQTQLAEKAGVSQSLIARIEAGTVDPRYSNLMKIFSVLFELKSSGKTKEITAEEIMTKKVVEVNVYNTIEAVAEKMKKHGVSQVPVVDGDMIVGSISERVILDQISRGVNASKFSTEQVREYMEENFPTVSPETPLNIISALLEHNTAVIVQEHGKTKGIITNADLLKVVHH